ncbi:MAG: hypothetical protein QME42_11545, partial [bacterium]|nr:hypothetical protein [bacterium]
SFINETDFKRFIMILRSAGFIESSMIRSHSTVNFAYIIYLVLKSQKIDPNIIESNVRKWFVMSVLTGRYSSSPESAFDYDIKRIDQMGFTKYMEDVEASAMSDAFWNAGLPQQMNTPVASSPYFNVYLAAQVYANDKGFLSRDITVRDLITHRGDVHHLFPRNYLKKYGLTQGRYNQIANYVMMQSEIKKEDVPQLLRKIKKNGFTFNEEEVIKRVEETGTFQIFLEDFHVDFLILSTEFEKSALLRKQKIVVYGIESPFPTPEDLILFKIVPARHIDMADVENIAKRYSGKLDKEYLVKWAQRLSDEAEDMRIYNQIGRLLKL